MENVMWLIYLFYNLGEIKLWACLDVVIVG